MKHLLVLLAIILQSIPQNFSTNGNNDVINIGAGSYSTSYTESQRKPSYIVYKTEKVTGALPTNKWWTTLLRDNVYSGELFPLPLCVQARREGLSIGYPNVVTRDRSILGNYINDMTIGTTESNAFPDTKLDGYGDWTITMKWERENTRMWATIGQGSPFAFFRFENGLANLAFPAIPAIWSGEESHIVGLTSNGHHYGLFAQPETSWSGFGSVNLINNWKSTHPSEVSSITVALLPEGTEKALTFFAQYAYNTVTSSKVDWAYDENTSRVMTTFTVTTDPPGKRTIFGLFPHQWKNFHGKNFLNYDYQTVKGKMKTVVGKSFTTVLPYNGILPSLPMLAKQKSGNDDFNMETLRNLLEVVRTENNGNHFIRDQKDVYWAGKAFQRISTLVPIARQTGNISTSNEFLDWLKREITSYFVATDVNGKRKNEFFFYYDKFFGTLIGYPGFVESDTLLHNHHFIYGHWIKASAEIAMQDTEWVTKWGPFVELLIKDIANFDRSDKAFPLLRNFDPYNGHSWASGLGADEGSSAEATNAWSAVILWGEATSNTALRDLGIYMFTTEVSAIQQYCFDVDNDVFPIDFKYNTVALIWGHELAYKSWVGTSPELIRGTNLSPITPSSMYLGHHFGYVMSYLDEMKKEKGNSDAWDAWREIFWVYQSLADADGAINLYNSQSWNTPDGESRAHTYSMLHAMKRLGVPTNKVTANTTFYCVFMRNLSKTYVAYNPYRRTIIVQFSDGESLKVHPRKWTVLRKNV